jgi:hypothetical protein
MPRFLFPFAIALGLPTWGPGAAAPPGPRPLSPAVRQRVDRAAARQPLETLAREGINLTGNLPAWLLSQVPLTPEEELTHARRVRAEVTRRHRPARPPLVAARVLARLVRELPPHLNPAPFRYELAVLGGSEPRAFTPGGGLLYLSRPLLDGLLAGGARGEAALAWVLAREVGHVALGHCRRGHTPTAA